MNYQITSEDIEIVCSQTSVSKEEAKRILKHNKSDIVQSILDIQNNNINYNKEKEQKNDDIEKDVDINNKENLKEYRKIVDEKDTIYQKMNEDKEKRKKENNKEELVFCNEKKYFIKRQNEGEINHIRIL